MITITEGSLKYTFQYDDIISALQIVCTHTYGYKWHTIINDSLVTESSLKDNIHIPPKKFYDFVISYTKGTLHDSIKIEFQQEPKGLGNNGFFDSVEYCEVPIVINIKFESVMGPEYDQFSYISLLPDTSITPENINNNRISGLEKNVSDILEKCSILYNKCESLDKNAEDTKKVFLSITESSNNITKSIDVINNSIQEIKKELDANKILVTALTTELNANKILVANLKTESDANKILVTNLKTESDANKSIVSNLKAEMSASMATLVNDIAVLKAPK